jgi:hypothetical protein
MIVRLMSLLFLGSAVLASAAKAPVNMAGQWTFQPAQSKNVGMMASTSIETTVTQTPAELTVDDRSVFNGQKDTQHTVYNLDGEPVSNRPIMGGMATTRSHWEGARLITVWESPGSIAGTTVSRTETRYLSPDGRSMVVESSRSGQDPMVMVFTRVR